MGIMGFFRKKQQVVFYEPSSTELMTTDFVDFGDGERHKFAEYLLQRKLVNKDRISAALMEQRVNKELIGAILVRNGFLEHNVLVDCILEFNPDRIATEKVTSSRIPVEILEEYSIVISADANDTIYVGTISDEAHVASIIRHYYPDKKLVFVAFLPDMIDDFLERIRQSNTDDIGEVRQEEVLDKLIFRALKDNASDLHIEPKPGSYAVFFRILGDRVLVHEGSVEEYNVISAQSKDRARMDLAERRIGQDGGYQIENSGKIIDLRVTTVPSVEGEKIVIRLLDPARVRPDISSLGITRLLHWRKGITRQNGLCLICGATGSGKTTTLSSSVRTFDTFSKSVYSIEDPVEYRIPFVSQVSANHQVGLDYPRAVKNFMRADPDIIIVGEVRDEETARNAIKAADTGHLVLATLHTSSILSSLSRLRDLGVAPHELRFNLRTILVQTLVKTICPHCDGDGILADESRCPVCKGMGYADRTVVSECMSFDDFASVDRIIEMTEKDTKFEGELPWPEVIDDAIDKMVDGITTMNELNRVFGIYADDRVRARGLKPEDFYLKKYNREQSYLRRIEDQS